MLCAGRGLASQQRRVRGRRGTHHAERELAVGVHDARPEHGGEPPALCELQGHFGVWPLFLWVRSDRAPEWDATFERVRDYLARHTVSRTD